MSQLNYPDYFHKNRSILAFIKLRVTDGRMDGPTDRRTETPSYVTLTKSSSVAPFICLSTLDWNAGGPFMVVPRFYPLRV